MDRHSVSIDEKEEALYHIKKMVSELTPQDIDTVFIYVKKTKDFEPVVEATGGTYETASDLRFYAGLLDDLLRIERNDLATLNGEAALSEGDPDPDSYN